MEFKTTMRWHITPARKHTRPTTVGKTVREPHNCWQECQGCTCYGKRGVGSSANPTETQLPPTRVMPGSLNRSTESRDFQGCPCTCLPSHAIRYVQEICASAHGLASGQRKSRRCPEQTASQQPAREAHGPPPPRAASWVPEEELKASGCQRNESASS